MSSTVRSWPRSDTTIVAGVAASQPSTSSPAHLCEEICSRRRSKSPLTPSTETILSPGASAPSAGGAETRLIDACGSLTPLDQTSTQRIRNASTMFTAGPAEMTTIRFHTGWR